jgi:hypothetical protein
VQPVASGNGTLTLRGTGTLLGFTGSVDAVVSTRKGDLIVAPDVPFGALATVTLFSNPHVAVEGVSAASGPGGFTVTANGTVK